MKKLLLSLLLLLAASSALPAQKPNIIYIITDDLGYNDISAYGQKHFSTPNIDLLATSGIRFTRHYSGATVCNPSRCSLMTGKDTGHASIRGNGEFSIPKDELTLGKITKAAGYHNAMIGKSCVTGNTQTPESVLEHGFDFFYGTTNHVDAHYRYPKFVYKNTEKINFPNNKLHTGTDYDLELYTKETLNYLSQQTSEKPFFLILSYPAPHASVLAREEDLIAARPSVKDEIAAEKERHYTPTSEVKANYIGMMKYLDDSIGQIIATLEHEKLLENTLVIFTSDNGPANEGGYKTNYLDSNGPLRGNKRDLYEGGIRVPLIASWPAAIKPGQTSDHPSAFWDFLPTVCELINQPTPKDIQGISFLPTLLGKGEQPKHPHLYWEHHEQDFRRAIQVGDWKLVQTNVALPDKITTELFDLSKDLGETTDISKQHPEKTAELLKLIQTARTPSTLFPVPAVDKPQP